MDARIIDLISSISDDPGCEPARLAERFGVSLRTVRTWVHEANSLLGKSAQIDLTRGHGYRLSISNPSAFSILMRGARTGLAVPSGIDTPEGRVSYLVNDLLSCSDWVTLDDLSALLFISRRTVSADLRRVEEILSTFDLSLERRPRYGMRVAGTELNRRLCLASLVMLSNDGSSPAAIPPNVEAPVMDVVASLREIGAIVDGAIADTGYSINSTAYRNLLVHIAVAVNRIRSDCYVPMESSQLAAIREKPEFEIARAIASGVSERFSVSLPEEEIAYISIHLSGKQALRVMEGESSTVIISDEVWDAVAEMLDLVYRGFHFDFRDDLELRMSLAQHIVPLTVRLRYRLRLENPLLSDIKSRFPLAYSMANDASTVLARRYGAECSEDEIGYLALAFALALERLRDEAPKKNILIVCASGAGSAKLLEYRYRQQFGPYVNEILTSDAAHINQIDLSRIDYVFTTVPLDRELPVPVRLVNFFLDDRDVEDMRGVLSASSEGDLVAETLSYLDDRLFIPHGVFAGKEGALRALCSCVAETRSVPPDFIQRVFERESLAQTAFGNRVAMPHPMEPCSDDTFVAVLLLDEPVAWGQQQVQAIFLVSIARERDHDLNDFYSVLSRMLLSTKAIDVLLGDQRPETLRRLLAGFAAETPEYGER